MKTAILYIHGKGGSAAECEHYKPLFPNCDIVGLDYKAYTPPQTELSCGSSNVVPNCTDNNDVRRYEYLSYVQQVEAEIRSEAARLKIDHDNIILIANSIGAYFSMNADVDKMVQTAFFISPIVDMEQLITNMMKWANVSEQGLQRERVISTAFGENLSWEYLCFVRVHPLKWTVPTHILYGSNDGLTSIDTITDFAARHNADLTVMENGEHWFHTKEQMEFLDNWIINIGG